ncbi:MAG TPA: S46 family peptidase, partial [Bacteroidales bacterium]|nr:S46 family peptidase [Bacteroidales bacterium]
TLKTVVAEHFKESDQAVEKKKMSEMLKLYRRNVSPTDLPSIFALIDKDFNGDIDAFTNDVYTKSIYATPENANAYLDKPSLKKMEKDPVYKMYLSFTESMMKGMSSYREATVSVGAANRLFIAGLREMSPNKVFYPDANSTMRMTYGKVLDYFPADAVSYNYFTTLKGVMQKEDPTNDEFIVEKKLKDLFKAKDYGPYGENGEMVTCFLTTNDITGGNSGSPVINGDGQLIGLAFDGNWEAMSGDIMFEPDLQRTINVDIRYVLFIIDKFAGANNIVNELTLVK